MTIKIKLYGDIREKLPHIKNEGGSPRTLHIKPEKNNTMLDILHRFNIKPSEISHIFINNKFSGIKNQVKDGDRIGIFPKRMGIIFVELMQE